MPTARERLLSSPSALRVLRKIVYTTELSSTCLPATPCGQPKRLSSSQDPRRRKDAVDRFIKSAGAGRVDGAVVELAKKAKDFDRTEPRFKIARFFSLDHESNVNNRILHKSNTLRIDTAAEHEKAKLWAEILQYRERVYGEAGVRHVFLGMTKRGYRLPTIDTPEAKVLWGTFFRHPQLVGPIIDHAAHLRELTGQLYPRLYESCMAYWLPRHPKQALDHHHRLLVKLRLRTIPLRQILHQLRDRLENRSLEAFMRIYRTSNERNLYDEIVPQLCDQRKFTMARRWHTMCIHRKDLPSASSAQHPVVKLFLAETSASSESVLDKSIVQKQEISVKQMDIKKSARPSRYNQELMKRLTGRDTASVRFEDPFCARLFATKAFPPESIIRGLTVVGVNEIGPQALRTMALRTEPLSELPARFADLRSAGISLQSSVFSLALETFAMEGKFNLVRSILDSDQHPDVFGDEKLQKELLKFYLDQSDWDQAHRTLAILALFHNDVSAESWNLLLQAHLDVFDSQRVIQILRDMNANKVFVSSESMGAIRRVLRPRRKGARPVHSNHSSDKVPGGFDDLRFVTRVYMAMTEFGIGNVYPFAWRELIRRFGMQGRLKELRRLLLWLLSWYAPTNSSNFTKVPRHPSFETAMGKLRKEYPERFQYMNTRADLPNTHRANPCRQLFPDSLQKALIVWGFKAALLPAAPLEQSLFSKAASKRHYRRRFVQSGVLKRTSWSEGLGIVVQLRDHGVYVAEQTVHAALRAILGVLFDQGRSSRKANRIMEDVNTKSYAEYAQEMNRIWGRALLPEEFQDERPAMSVQRPLRRVQQGDLDLNEREDAL